MPQLFHSWAQTQTPDSPIEIFEPHVYWRFIHYCKQNEPTYFVHQQLKDNENLMHIITIYYYLFIHQNNDNKYQN